MSISSKSPEECFSLATSLLKTSEMLKFKHVGRGTGKSKQRKTFEKQKTPKMKIEKTNISSVISPLRIRERMASHSLGVSYEGVELPGEGGMERNKCF